MGRDEGTSDAAPDAVEGLNVVPLLKAYRGALRLACHPPASLRLPPALARWHCRLRPTFGCQYFVTRHVRTRIQAVERALAARIAVGEADDNDQAELEALRSFRSSLVPSPSRGWFVAALIVVILLSQALIGGLLTAAQDVASLDGEPSRIDQALKRISVSPDVRSIGELGRSLASANVVELFMVFVGVTSVVYLLGRPLISGFRLGQLCLGRRAWMSAKRRDSPLCQHAGRLAIPARELGVARITGTEVRRGFPLDLVVKAAPWIAGGCWLVLVARFEEGPGYVSYGGLALLGVVAVGWPGLLTWLLRRVRLVQARGWRAALWLLLGPVCFSVVVVLVASVMLMVAVALGVRGLAVPYNLRSCGPELLE